LAGVLLRYLPIHRMQYIRCLILALFLTFGQNTLAQLPGIVRGPYLQVLTPNSVVVRWRTDQPTTGRVWFGLSANQLTENIRESQPTLEHTLTITGLQPATRYAYAIGYDETQLALVAVVIIRQRFTRPTVTQPPTNQLICGCGLAIMLTRSVSKKNINGWFFRCTQPRSAIHPYLLPPEITIMRIAKQIST
jgi:hypothetical protein